MDLKAIVCKKTLFSIACQPCYAILALYSLDLHVYQNKKMGGFNLCMKSYLFKTIH